MPDASAAEAAERKRVMESVAQMLEAAVQGVDRGEWNNTALQGMVLQLAAELRRTPVGREKNQ